MKILKSLIACIVILSQVTIAPADVIQQKEGTKNCTFVLDTRQARYGYGDAFFSKGSPAVTVARTNDATHWGTYQNSAGTLVRDSSNTIRLAYGTYDINGYTPYPNPIILREGAVQNMVWWNEDLTNAQWVKTDTTIGSNEAAAPDAATTADSVTATAANGTCIQATAGVDASSASVFLKRKTGTGKVYVTWDNGETYTDITAALAAGLVVGEWIRPYSEGYVAATSRGIGIKIETSGDAVYMWGAQMESGKKITSSYIPTNGTRYTRNKDSLTYAGASNFTVSDSGSILLRFRILRKPNQQVAGNDYRTLLMMQIDASNYWTIKFNSQANNYCYFTTKNATSETATSFGNFDAFNKYDSITLIVLYSAAGSYPGQSTWKENTFVNGMFVNHGNATYPPVGAVPNIVMDDSSNDMGLEVLIFSPEVWTLDEVAEMQAKYGGSL